MSHRLRVSGGARAGETLDLAPGRVYVIGRGKEADLRFPEDPYLSRAHVEIHPDGNGWKLKNLSKHGTLVAGKRTQGELRLAPSDVIMVGGTLVVFERVDAAGANKPWPAGGPGVPLAGPAIAKPGGPTANVDAGAAAAIRAQAAELIKAEQARKAEAKAADAKAAEKEDESEELKSSLPVVFLPGDSREPTSEELAQHALFAGIPAKTIEGSIIKRHKINDQPPIWLRKYQPGEIICKEGDYGSTAYFITQGSVYIGINAPQVERKSSRNSAVRAVQSFVKTLTGQTVTEEPDDDESEEPQAIPVDAPVGLPYDQPVAELKAGDLFGEMSCMSFYPRSATCVAGNDGVEVLEMLRSVLDFIRTNGKAAYKDRIEKNYRERTLDIALRNVPIFASLPPTFVDLLRPHISMVDFNPDTYVCKEGDPADAFYLVRLGFVKVSQQRPGGEVVLQYLGPGQFFGEIALINGGKRTASVTALDHVELIKVDKAHFDELVQKFPELQDQLKRATQERLGQQRKLADHPGEMPLSLLADKGVMNAQNLLAIDLDKCTRCDECVRACADSHGGITRLVRDGLRIDRWLVATACRACTDPVCMIGCPVGSIRRRNSLEIIIEDWCIGCNKCAQQCPYGNITMHPYTKAVKVQVEENGKTVRKKEIAVVNGGKGKAVTCDLCGGGMVPRCVYACPHDAAKRGHPFEIFASTLPIARS